MGKPGLIILDDDETVRGQMRWAFSRDYEVFEAGSRGEALLIARAGKAPVGIMDLGLPPSPQAPSEGMAAVKDILSANPLFKAIVVTGLDQRDNAMRALDLGAFDFFTKPVSIDEVRLSVRRATHTWRLQAESMGSMAGAAWPGELIGLCQPMQEVFSMVRRLAEVNLPVLIRGEPGVGKETLARAVHRTSVRHSMPFVKVACDSMPEAVASEELFGGGRAGLPGRKGKLQIADGGTIYIEEAGSLGRASQERLLRHLRGSQHEPFADARIMTSSTRDLRQSVRAGDFSEELYNRLGIINLDVPPLRDRREDIAVLSAYFLKKYSRELGRQVTGFTKGAAESMSEYDWPGNVREMENRIRRAVALADRREITAEDLAIPPGAGADCERPGLSDTREAFRKRMIREVLAKNFGNVSRTAGELGISRQYLSRLIARFNIKVPR